MDPYHDTKGRFSSGTSTAKVAASISTHPHAAKAAGNAGVTVKPEVAAAAKPDGAAEYRQESEKMSKSAYALSAVANKSGSAADHIAAAKAHGAMGRKMDSRLHGDLAYAHRGMQNTHLDKAREISGKGKTSAQASAARYQAHMRAKVGAEKPARVFTTTDMSVLHNRALQRNNLVDIYSSDYTASKGGKDTPASTRVAIASSNAAKKNDAASHRAAQHAHEKAAEDAKAVGRQDLVTAHMQTAAAHKEAAHVYSVFQSTASAASRVRRGTFSVVMPD